MSEFALIFLMGPGCREKRRHGVLSQGVFSVFRGGRHGGLSGGCVVGKARDGESCLEVPIFLHRARCVPLVIFGLLPREVETGGFHSTSHISGRMGYAVGSEYEYHD
jgi:hypothetical protein